MLPNPLLQERLKQLTDLRNQLNAEVKLQYGEQASLFFEVDGNFFIRNANPNAVQTKKQKHTEFSSACPNLQVEAWE